MRSRFLAVLVLALCAAIPRSLAAQSESVTVDYIVLVDVSGSMDGLPAGQGNARIFPDVKENLKALIRKLDNRQSVMIQPFADGLRPGRRFELRTPADQAEAIRFVESLRADGQNTYIYSSLLQAFDQYNRSRGNRTDRVAALLVYTDGTDNGRPRRAMRQIVDQLRLKRQQYDYLYYATLGVRLSEQDAEALESSGFAAYDPTPKGEVHPTTVVEMRYPALDFGNLLLNPRRRREQRFDVRGSLPPQFRVQARTVFPEVRAQNAAVEVAPDSLTPSGRVELGLDLVNAQDLAQKQYAGVVEFRSPVPWVLLIPRTISTRFRYAPRRFVRLNPADSGPGPLSLGTVDPFRARDGRDSTSRNLPLAYDAVTQREGGTFRVRVEEDSRNPKPLPPGSLRVNGRASAEQRLDARDTRQLRVTVSLTASDTAVVPGTYSGLVVIEPDRLEVEGRNTISWTVTVAARPWPWWVVFLLGCTFCGVVGGSVALLRPRLRGRLVLEAPSIRGGRSIQLGGARMYLGPDATEVEREDAVLEIRAEGHRWQSRPTVVSGGLVTYTRAAGGPRNVPFDVESLEEGDRLAIGPYHLRYTET